VEWAHLPADIRRKTMRQHQYRRRTCATSWRIRSGRITRTTSTQFLPQFNARFMVSQCAGPSFKRTTRDTANPSNRTFKPTDLNSIVAQKHIGRQCKLSCYIKDW
jgi:hypothetical protein